LDHLCSPWRVSTDSGGGVFLCVGVGKTSLVVRYVKNTFDPASESTIGASFLAKKVVVDDCLVRLQVWVFVDDSLIYGYRC